MYLNVYTCVCVPIKNQPIYSTASTFELQYWHEKLQGEDPQF